MTDIPDRPEGGRPAADAQLRFFELLFDGLDGFVEFRAIDPEQLRPPALAWVCAKSLEQAPPVISRLQRRHPGFNVYVGIAARRERGIAGTKNGLAATGVAWVDLDHCGEAELGERLAGADLAGHPPSIVIASGGGFHLYWLLREPIQLGDERGIGRLEAVNRGLCAAAGGDFRACDATRILRPPGTTNYPDEKKREAGRVEAEVRLIRADAERRYAIDDFAGFEERGSRPAEADYSPSGPGYDPGSWDGTLPERATALLENRPRLRDRVGGDASGLADASNSGFDMSIATMLALEGLTAQEVGDACQHWRTVRGGGEKHPGYWTTLVAKALRSAEEHRREPAADPREDFADELRPLAPVALFERHDLTRGSRGGTIVSFQNAVRAILSLDLDPRYDEMGDRIMLLGAGYEALRRLFPALTREVGDTTLVAIRSALASRRETSACASWKDNELNRALDAVAHHRSFNPLVEWLRSLRWDGVERIGRWLVDYCGSPDTPYVRAVGSLFLRGAVARAFTPSVKFDYLTILESPQGYLKSSMIGVLGGEFAREGLRDLRSKDVIDDLRGAWIVELEELQVTRREDVQTLKAFLSRTADRARLAYGRRSQTYVRRFVMIGTTNDAQYLRDDTGNRRFLPVRVTREIDLDGVRRDREQLFAEAVARWDADPRAESLVLPRELWAAAAEEQELRRESDPWEELIEEWLDQPEQVGRVGFQASEILERALHVVPAQQDKHKSAKVGAAMRRLGWEKKSSREGGKVRTMFVAPEEQLALRRCLAKLSRETLEMLSRETLEMLS